MASAQLDLREVGKKRQERFGEYTLVGQLTAEGAELELHRDGNCVWGAKVPLGENPLFSPKLDPKVSVSVMSFGQEILVAAVSS